MSTDARRHGTRPRIVRAGVRRRHRVSIAAVAILMAIGAEVEDPWDDPAISSLAAGSAAGPCDEEP